MPLSLHAATVPQFRQLIASGTGFIAQAEAFCTGRGVPAADIIDARLAEDMLPFAYQVKSMWVHSIGAIEGVRSGVFSPNRGPFPTDFATLRQTLTETDAALAAIDPGELDALGGSPMRFEAGERRMDFTDAAGFLLSFSLPNFYFHTTTAYAILRNRGVPLGKRDYLGRPLLKG